MFTMREMAEGGKMVVPHGQPIRMRQTRASEQAQRPDTRSPVRGYRHSLPLWTVRVWLQDTRRVSQTHGMMPGAAPIFGMRQYKTSRGFFLAYGHPVGSRCEHRPKGPPVRLVARRQQSVLARGGARWLRSRGKCTG